MSDEFRCPPAARWLPRALAAAVMAGALLAGAGLDVGVPGVPAFRVLLAVAAGLIATWIVMSGSDVHRRVRIVDRRVELGPGGRAADVVALDEVLELDWEPPLSAGLRWLPAMVLRDRHGREWRVSALLGDGGRFVAELVAAGGRAELASWSQARGLDRRMDRWRVTVAGAYAVAAAIVAAGLALAVR